MDNKDIRYRHYNDIIVGDLNDILLFTKLNVITHSTANETDADNPPLNILADNFTAFHTPNLDFFTLWYKFDKNKVRVMTEYNNIRYFYGNPDASKFNRGEFAYFSSGILAIKDSANVGMIRFYTTAYVDLIFLNTITYYHQLTFILGDTIQLRVCLTSKRDTAYNLTSFAAECVRRSVWNSNIIGRSGFPCQVIFNADNNVSKNVINATYNNGIWLFQTSDSLGVNSWKTISQVVPNETARFELFSDDFTKIE